MIYIVTGSKEMRDADSLLIHNPADIRNCVLSFWPMVLIMTSLFHII